jgi:hypothetical protein
MGKKLLAVHRTQSRIAAASASAAMGIKIVGAMLASCIRGRLGQGGDGRVFSELVVVARSGAWAV